MKKTNQIRRNRKAAALAAQTKAPRRRIRILLPPAARTVIKSAAAARGLTVSQFAEEAIRKELWGRKASKARRGNVALPATRASVRKSLVRPMGLNASAKEQKPWASAIPQGWTEVAFIDFAGYLDRDCEERVIYKTPEGELKAAKRSENEVIENVTRAQVVRWILECVIPEEFEADFSSTLTK